MIDGKGVDSEPRMSSFTIGSDICWPCGADNLGMLDSRRAQSRNVLVEVVLSRRLSENLNDTES
jgi:hypothetical protein